MAGFLKNFIDVVSLNFLKPEGISPNEILKASNNLDFENNIKAPVSNLSSKTQSTNDRVTEPNSTKLNVEINKTIGIEAKILKNFDVKELAKNMVENNNKDSSKKTLKLDSKPKKLADNINAERKIKKESKRSR